MELTLTDFTHFGTEINILCMQKVPKRLPTSVEGIIINRSHYSSWIIIITLYLALPHKARETRQCLPLLHKPTEIVMKQSICCVLFQLKHSRSWGAYFIHCRNNAIKSLCLNDTSLHCITVQSGNLVCITLCVYNMFIWTSTHTHKHMQWHIDILLCWFVYVCIYIPICIHKSYTDITYTYIIHTYTSAYINIYMYVYMYYFTYVW